MKQDNGINLNELSKTYLLENGFKYYFIYYLNDICIGEIDEIKEINSEILYEAMFFNEYKQLHFFEDEDNGFKGVLTEKTNEDNIIYERYVLKENIGKNLQKNKYKYMKIANYLDYEDDGQAYIKATCLCKLEEVN